MGSNNGKIIIVSSLACVGIGLGTWQAREYFSERKPMDASGASVEAGESRKSVSGPQKIGEKTTAMGETAATGPSSPAAEPVPEMPTQFVKVPSAPESVKVVEEFTPQFAIAVKANVELGQATRTAQNALVAAAVDALEKILGVKGTPADVMGARPEAAEGTIATASTSKAGPAPERGARIAGMEALLKDASVDASRATVDYFPDGAMGLPKRTKPTPGEQRSQFQATMRMSSRMMGAEKVPTAEVRIPVKTKDSPSPGDDLDIGVLLERDESGEKWTPAGFNLHLKKPEIMKKMGGTLNGGTRRQAPAAAPAGTSGGAK